MAESTVRDINEHIRSMDVLFHKAGGNLERFLELNRPTLVRKTYYWVYVTNPSFPRDGDDCFDPDDLDPAVERLLREGEVTAEKIKGIARETRCLSGKWMVFSDKRTVDDVWSGIARATIANELGMSTKVVTAFGLDQWNEKGSMNSTEHVICVYTSNFLDETDVMDVEQKLRRLGITGRLTYKPDIYTYLNIYKHTGNRQWNVPPTIYTTY